MLESALPVPPCERTLMIALSLTPELREMFLPSPIWDDLVRLGPIVPMEEAEVLVTGWETPRLDAEALERAPRLRLVAHTGAAVGFLVSDALWDRGIRVTQTGAAMAPAVGEMALTFTLSLLHQVHRFDHRLRSGGGWEETRAAARPARELRGSVVGVVGASRTGRAYLELVRPLGAELLLTDPLVDAAEAAALGATLVPLDELLSRSDVVALHAPAIPATRHLLGRRELALLRDGAALVNTARSWLVDSDALLDELRAGRIDAALDVFDEEPLPLDSPLRALPNVLLTPHQAAATVEGHERQGRSTVAEIARFLSGEPLRHEITRERLRWTA
ncbi:3-phosphoglycerate dehydrogenase [Nonomuraea aridisoli]|uniref:3-phosphoglycerate dehydrogenase n=2 Tax=Nonomuraea aridisoli TaxID=2070368 RepID=A0A2W2DMY9_9ACTN|nr:3-phosphoglycerate dehydrogenase [Nonomuraea aridisoli]